MNDFFKDDDERLVALYNTNISESAFDLVEKNGYDKMKEYIDEDSFDVLSSQFDLWFEKCPELKDVSIHWVRSVYGSDVEMTDGRLKRKLLKRTDFHDLCGVLARVRERCCETIPPFLESLMEAILSEEQVLYCATHSLDVLCDNYFAEIREYMSYVEKNKY